MRHACLSKKYIIFFTVIIVGILLILFTKNFWETRFFGFNQSNSLPKITNTYKQTIQYTLTPTPTIFPTPTPTQTPKVVAPTNLTAPLPIATPSISVSAPTLSTHTTWAIQSIDAMKDTKDAVCEQRSTEWINKWLDKAVELGVNYVAIATPYDNPSCGDSLAYTKTWVTAIRAHGLHVWHRHMPLAFEGIYNVQKNNSNTFLDLIKNYITSNPDLFQSGDIVTPIPEPQNGGIQGITSCASSLCQFSSATTFNQWLRDAMATTNDALTSIGKGGQLKVGYFGFDGFIAWGDNNPDWNGILEDSTVQQMGNITIDHYPELIHETMAQGLQALSTKYPHTPIVIGEWGTVNGVDVVQQVTDDMGAAKNDMNVIGFNYWQFGPSGSGEQLINDDFTNRSQFSAVQSFYK